MFIQSFINDLSVIQSISSDISSYFSFIKVFSNKVYPIISMGINFIVLFLIFLIFSFKAFSISPSSLYQKLLHIKRKQ